LQFTRLRSRLSYANVLATAAIFVALGGTSYAAVTITGKEIKDRSVTGVDIRNASLTGADIRAQSVRGDDIKDGSLLAQDFQPGQLPVASGAVKGEPGPQGPQGAKGDKGEKGDKGDQGLAGPAAGSALSARINDVPPVCCFTTTTSWGSVSGTSLASNSGSSREMLSPNTATVASNLAVSQTVAPPGGNREFILQVNGADTALRCKPGSGAASCTSNAQVQVPAASRLAIRITGTTGTAANPATDALVGLRLSTP
jgi:hypothetical protein